MNKRKRSKKRVQDLQSSLTEEHDGGMTTHFVKSLVTPLIGEPVACTITGHCRTFVYKFPSADIASQVPVVHQMIYSDDDLNAAIVSDLPAYFEYAPAPSRHYAINVSLRANVSRIYEDAIKQSGKKTDQDAPLFLVIEETAEVPPTELNSGQCYLVDECLDGVPMIEGGRTGERAFLAFHTSDAPWPDFQTNMHAVNKVLAAVKVEQNYTGHIEMLHQSSCFVSGDGQAVYTQNIKMSADLSGMSRIDPSELGKKAEKIGSMLNLMMSESEPVLAELFNSIVMDKTKDDYYLRQWYLRLWQALDDAGSYIGKPQPFNDDKVLAGKRSPKELRSYRKDIAHWHTGKIDHSCLSDLQLTVMELLRRHYGESSGGNLNTF